MVQAHVQLMWPRAALAGLLLLLGACSVQPVAPPEPLPPVEVAEDSPAASLLALADSARARNDFSAAGRYLERALSVSRSGEATVLYRELAELRLAENEPRAAEGLALRALREAPDHPLWQADLWDLVAEARDRQGNDTGRDSARDNAERLREAP